MDKLVQVNCLGTNFWHYFQMPDNSIQVVSCTQKDYEALAQPNPSIPKIVNGVWIKSKIGPAFSTPTGELSKGEYSIINSSESLISPFNGLMVKDLTTKVLNGVYTK